MTRKKMIVVLGVASLLVLPVTIAVGCGPDFPDDPGHVVVSAAASAIGSALDRIAMLPENRDPIHQGHRTFEVSRNVLVRAVGVAADGLESVVHERGWRLVEDGVDPRVCDETMPDDWGWPHCVLGSSDPNALYLDIRSVMGIEPSGHQVDIWAYRNVSVPYNRDLAQGVGFTNDAKYDRLVTRLSDHPGVLNGMGPLGNPGTFKVIVNSNIATSHEYKGSSRIHRRSAEELAWNDKWSECHALEESGDRSGYRDCVAEYLAMAEVMLEAANTRAETAVVEARGRK